MAISILSKKSIRSKLTWAILFSCLLVLTVSSSGLLISEIYASKIALQQEIRVLSSSIAANCSRSLVLEKHREAEQILSTLVEQPNIHAAYLFAQSGKPVAEYLKLTDAHFVMTSVASDFDGSENVTIPTRTHFKMGLTHLSGLSPVKFAGETVGSIYVLSDLTPLYTRVNYVFLSIVLAFLVMLLGSWFVARRIQKPLSEPLLRLTEMMSRVGSLNDYSVRADRLSDDEVGTLVDGFNTMLEQIERQQGALVEHQRNLERTVALRTAELRETVQKLEQARKEANAANEAKSEFLSKMTHELRTPLIGVLGMNELLQRTVLDDQQKVLTETVQKSGEELLTLISDVLDISKIEAGKLDLDSSVVDFHQIVEDVAHLLFPTAQAKGIKLQTDVSTDALWSVLADESRLRQIVMNLVGNAIKFTCEGWVRVHLSCRQKGPQAGIFTLAVEDSGIGMDETARENIFEMFYQSDGGGRQEQQGAGLGLAIVHQLVDLMKGKLKLESEVGRGSRFQVELPLTLIENRSYQIPSSLNGESVLLCVIDESLRKLLSQRLSDLGLKSESAVSADAVLYRLKTAHKNGHPFATVIVDLEMKTLLGQPIRDAFRDDKELLKSQKIILIDDGLNNIVLGNHETRLPLPLSWSELHASVVRSWESLKLVSEVRKSEIECAAECCDLVLIGQNVASLELNRLLLEKNGLQIRTLNSLSGFTSGQDSSQILMIECPFTPEDILTDFLSENRDRRIILLSATPQDELISDFNCSLLLKPLTDKVVGDHLLPLALKVRERKA